MSENDELRLNEASKKQAEEARILNDIRREQKDPPTPLENDVYLFDTLQQHAHAKQLTLALLRKLHEDALPHASYRGRLRGETMGEKADWVITVGGHVAVPNSEAKKEMELFVRWLSDEDEKVKASTSEYGAQKFIAIAHIKLTTIHCFPNGNGRVCRALMSLLAIRYGFKAFTIGEYLRYKETLKEAVVRKQEQPFIDFIAIHLQSSSA
ncbi:hypothetical protein niasHT_017049 [Heterodera trifolii]|uniref:Fido domain-containing protein n=1 Tax=Heterodera trifolii TaxID=157864 RepID=A0ABD2KYR7_9BILA